MRMTLRQKIKVSLLTLLASSLIFAESAVAQAIDTQFFSGNDILFYGEEGGACSVGSGSLDGPAPTSLMGESNAEKVWNYFVGRGLTPIAAAGAMGNLEQESAAFNPWEGEGGNRTIDKSVQGVGFGLIQWTNTGGDSQGRRYKVMKHMEDNGVRLDATDDSQLDKALLLQLNWLWDGEYNGMTWQEPVNKETTVEGDVSVDPFDPGANEGNGSTLYFHAAVERSDDQARGILHERIDSAKGFLEKFGEGSGVSDCGYGSGGMTLEQAQQFMHEYITSPEVDSLVSEQTPYCTSGPHGWRANCVTFSRYFLRKMTDIQPAQGDGIDVAPNTAAASGAELGTTPKPYSIFSMPTGMPEGHTGVIMAVDNSRGTMIVAEANCNAAGPKAVSDSAWDAFTVREVEISSFPSSAVYMYTDGRMKDGA